MEAEESNDPEDIAEIFKIEGIKTYEEYELNNNMTRDLEEPWLDNRVPYQLCRELPGMVWVKIMTYFQDHKWNYGADNTDYTQDNQDHKKEHYDPSTFRVRRFEMIKYAFDADDEYVAIKEHKYSEHSETNIDTCQAYRELFCIMDEEWLVTKACDE
ncbi:hypothetical protein Tco_1016630 [Tanacetum coccineum]|uniref:Uncharacterized protein n=1 Tax=Tanacetum coccineum TaxID=301880 RepID=A0ABQ5FP66_9ASTR